MPATATFIGANSSTDGTLEQGGDLDYFRLVLSARTTLTAESIGNTDTVGQLEASDGSVLASNDDAGSENFSIREEVSAGTYYIQVRGYSPDVAGPYTLVVSSAGTPSEIPDLVVESPAVSSGAVAPDESFTLSATVRNQGAGAAGSTTLRYYQSRDSTITTGDTGVGTDAVPALTGNRTSSLSTSLRAPNSAGTYYYGACVDAVGGESDTGNNCSIGVRVVVSSSSDDHGDTRATATPIGSNSSTPGTLDRGDFDYFRLVLSARTTLTAESTGNTDTFGRLMASDGSVLASNDDGAGSGVNFRIREEVSAGTYYIQVSGFLNAAGPYTLVVSATTSIQPPPTTTSCSTDLETVSGTSAITGRWDGSCPEIYGSHGFGRTYRFNLSREARVEVAMSVNAPPGSRWLVLRTVNTFIRAYNGDNASFARTLQAGGYSVLAFSETTGSFTLNFDIEDTPSPPPSTYCIEDLGDMTASSRILSSSWRAECLSSIYPRGSAQLYTFNLSRRSNVRVEALSRTMGIVIDIDPGSVPDGAPDLRSPGSPGLPSVREEVLDPGQYNIEVARRGTDDSRHQFQLTVNVEDIPQQPPDRCGELLQVDFYRDPASRGDPLFDARFRNTCAFDIYLTMKADLYRDPFPTTNYASPRGSLSIPLSPGESGWVCADDGPRPTGEPCIFVIHAGVLAVSSINDASTLYYTHTSCRTSGPDLPPCEDPEDPIPGVSPSVRIGAR